MINIRSICLLLFVLLINLLHAGTTDSLPLFQVKYKNNSIIIDGNSSDWESVSGIRFKDNSNVNSDKNDVLLRMLWDKEALYFSVIIKDKRLIGLEKSTEEGRLHFNDSFELYLDTQNDSKAKFDLNDYQFLFDLKGGLAIFKGDRLNTSLLYIVPKASGIANIIIEHKTRLDGTLNNNDDIDSSFFIECRIPWMSIGKVIKAGDLMKADFCINDNDTLVNFHQIESEFEHNYHSISILGNSDFGFPSVWPVIQFVGSESLLSSVTREVSIHGIFFFILSVFALLIAGILLLKIKKSSKIESRTKESNQPLVQYLTTTESNVVSKAHPVIDKTRDYVDQNLTENIKLEELSGEMAMSLRQLQRIFQSELNTTPKAFIITYKLEKAAEMFKNDRLSVSEVTYRLGFNNPSYFSRIFKKYFGMTPTNYIELEQKKLP